MKNKNLFSKPKKGITQKELIIQEKNDTEDCFMKSPLHKDLEFLVSINQPVNSKISYSEKSLFKEDVNSEHNIENFDLEFFANNNTEIDLFQKKDELININPFTKKETNIFSMTNTINNSNFKGMIKQQEKNKIILEKKSDELIDENDDQLKLIFDYCKKKRKRDKINKTIVKKKDINQSNKKRGRHLINGKRIFKEHSSTRIDNATKKIRIDSSKLLINLLNEILKDTVKTDLCFYKLSQKFINVKGKCLKEISQKTLRQILCEFGITLRFNKAFNNIKESNPNKIIINYLDSHCNKNGGEDLIHKFLNLSYFDFFCYFYYEWEPTDKIKELIEFMKEKLKIPLQNFESFNKLISDFSVENQILFKDYIDKFIWKLI